MKSDLLISINFVSKCSSTMKSYPNYSRHPCISYVHTRNTCKLSHSPLHSQIRVHTRWKHEKEAVLEFSICRLLVVRGTSSQVVIDQCKFSRLTWSLTESKVWTTIWPIRGKMVFQKLFSAPMRISWMNSRIWTRSFLAAWMRLIVKEFCAMCSPYVLISHSSKSWNLHAGKKHESVGHQAEARELYHISLVASNSP